MKKSRSKRPVLGEGRSKAELSAPEFLLRPDLRGLLASPGLGGQPVKGAYFFPGERGAANARTYTTHPLDARDLHWDSDLSTRGWVMDRMVRAHVNTVVMSYWSNMPQWSPMQIGPTTLSGVLDAVQGRPLVIMPTIEGGFDSYNPDIPGWQFFNEFPFIPGNPFFELAPGLVRRIGQLVELFSGRMNLWAKMYDREGFPRHVVHLLDVCSDIMDRDTPGADDIFANALNEVAAIVEARFKISVGFTINPSSHKRYTLFPNKAGASLEQTASVLAIHAYMSEISDSPFGLIKNGPPCGKTVDWRLCQTHDNNVDNIEIMADWKRTNLAEWLRTRVPVILDVSNGFDGRIVWSGAEGGAGFWGDNLDYTDDRWRNWMSQLKGVRSDGIGIKGITFSTWNGYTEGYAAVPSREHGYTVYNWLTDLLEPPPWDHSHMHYADGARTHRVYGAICEKWIQLGADRGFGAPVSDELPSTLGRMQNFANGNAIYWSGSTGAHEVHGIIAKTYREEGGDASFLGLPVSDELRSGDGRVSFFQNGRINWHPGDTRGSLSLLAIVVEP